MELDNQLAELRKEQKKWKNAAFCLGRFYDKKLSMSNTRSRLVKLGVLERGCELPEIEEISLYRKRSRELAPLIGQKKSLLKDLLDEFSGVRVFREEFLNPYNVISLFDSELTRTCKLLPDVLTGELLVVKACYFKILKDIILNGFTLRGAKYVWYTASAGQIRTKRMVFISDELLKRHADTLMCGLSFESINADGGVNINKALAYIALTNSATDRWEDFDIDRCIVVDDMELPVTDMVDYIDENTYDITRQIMDIPIEHTDGCGMILPSVSKKNFMARLPWCKGLLAVFPFDKFIREANRREPGVNHGLIRDIYGQEYDILADNIQIILTKSQFKMNKFYKNWDDYKEKFKKFNCYAGICNEEPDVFDCAKINYQMLQTLVDLTDDELRHTARFTEEKLRKISHDRDTMLRVFGATAGNTRKNAFQECLMLYPELLQDEYCRDTLRKIKTKIEKEAVAGRLDVNGHYSFLIPDLYAFCEWMFLKNENPVGLLQDGEVHCRLFPPGKDIACLRSPHLYREWAVRRNVAGMDDERKRWFVTDGLYTSCHDTISKILQFDNDGDMALIIDDDVLISAAKRNMTDIVPLYYLGLKGPAQEITSENVYESLIWAYTSCNIGVVSNEITKIWSGNREIELDLIKYLCQDNNLVIDAAKNLYRPPRPDFLVERLKPYVKTKVPHFFMEAKGKQEHQVAPINTACVNRLREVIPKSRLNFSARQLGKFDWKMLTSSDTVPNNDISQKIIDTFTKLSSGVRLNFNDDNDDSNVFYICSQIRNELLHIYNGEDYVVDVLVRHLFRDTKTKNKTIFWTCWGSRVLDNLRRNVKKDMVMCHRCGVRFKKTNGRQYLCEWCLKKQTREIKSRYDRKTRENLRNNA